MRSPLRLFTDEKTLHLAPKHRLHPNIRALLAIAFLMNGSSVFGSDDEPRSLICSKKKSLCWFKNSCFWQFSDSHIFQSFVDLKIF